MKRIATGIFFSVLFVMTTAVASAQQPPVKRFDTKDGKKPGGLFTSGVMVGKTLYLSGKGDYRPEEDFTGKVRNCLEECRKTLQVFDLDMQHVVNAFCYLEDWENYPLFNEVYGEFFPNDPPARTTLGVPHVPGD
ncbi:MAG: RidA family protein [Candidatus Latescibacteria bacterium]|nr:RidA family protein [Candidatus Latescibacterota bacterium]